MEVTNEGTGSSNEIIDSTKLHVEIWDTDDSTYKYNADKNIKIKKVNTSRGQYILDCVGGLFHDPRFKIRVVSVCRNE